ncbi:hypothetical protein O4214_05820 [Rhodococcus erythropolis]|uniref:hypothetical protein n=1 Tax=Rhodococcus erythropolis TaxID=1833 RepID=UPI001E43B50F|nr:MULTISPECIES: hypothetical protein [Rhodococcus erythropolis group]MCD2104436.1 hypothetical protein [Rhodococcus qingshengii]MCZ4523490.1 hypothetical protein [Rhodococcus erythropolis]
MKVLQRSRYEFSQFADFRNVTVPYEPPESWIPADQRRFGLDRRTILPGLVVLVIAAVLSLGPSAVDGQIDYADPVQSGDVIAIGETVRFTPIPG